MFGRPITVFELLGFEVKLDASWILLALLIAWSLAQGFFPALYEGMAASLYWWMALAGVIGLFFSLVFHELAHSLVARRYGLPIRGITLFIFGGVAEMEEEPARPKTEFLMAIAGPIASAGLALAFYGVAALADLSGAPGPVVAVAGYLALLNALLAAFNIVPAFPLDGGRVLRAALWHWQGDLKTATRIATRVGTGFAYLLIAAGVVSAVTGDIIGGVWWFLIGVFLRIAAVGSYRRPIARRALEGERVRRFMTAGPVTVPPDITVAKLVDDYFHTSYHDLYPVTADSRLIGGVTTRQIKAVPRAQWGSVTVGLIAVPCSPDNTVEADQDAVKTLSLMRRTGASRLMVTEDGRLAGIVALKDLLKLLSLKIDLEGEP